MYKKIYRQEGGLAEEGYRAQIREAARKKIEDWKESTKGEVGELVGSKPPISQRIKKGISSLVPDTYRNLRTIPLTGIDVGTKALLNKYLPWLSGDTKPSYIRTPEMDQQVLDAIMRQREGKGPGSGSLGYSDWGVEEAPVTGGYLGPGDMLYGTPGLANALTLGRIDYDIDPVTNKITFPQGGAYDFEREESPPHLRFIYDALKDYGGDVSPKNLYYKSGQAAQQLGDIEAQVNPYDQGLTSLPEAQPIGERPTTTYYTKWTPEQLTGPLWSAGETWSEGPKMQPPGLDPYGGVFADRVNWNRDWANKKIAEIQAQNYSPETEARYIADRKRHLENVEDLVRRQTADFNTQRNWAYGQLNLPVPTQPYTPIGFQGTGYGQFSPQAAGAVQPVTNLNDVLKPVNTPSLVKYTPPFYGGGMIPETQMIPANDPRITGPFTVKSPTGPMPIGMPVVPGGPAI